MHRYGFGPGFGYERAGMFVMMIIFILIIALLLFLAIRSGFFKHHHNYNVSNNTNNRALEILNERLASGEITEEEYTSKKLLITGK